MNQDKAREILAETWRFSRVGELIALREVALIEAVRDHEAAHPAGPSTPPAYIRLQPPRSS